MKKFIVPISLALAVLGGPAFAGFTQTITGQSRTRSALTRPTVPEGLGNSSPTEGFTANASNQMERKVACFELLYLSVTPTMVGSSAGYTATNWTGPVCNTDWIDATAWSDLVVETNFNGGCGTLLVESANSWTITGVVNPTNFYTLSTIYGAVGVLTPVQTHITFFGKYVRFRIPQNTSDSPKNTSTISVSSIFRLL